MASTMTSLGLGSDGVLSYDIIDQLREVDESNQVKPLEAKIETNTTKQSDLSIISTLTSTFKASTSSLSDELSYLQRSALVSDDAISVTVEAGTNIQNFNIDIQNLALKDVYQSKSFANKNTTFASGNDTIRLSIDGQDYDIDVDSTTSITELKDKITDATDGKISASILNVGGDEPYKLIIQSTDTGENNAITMTSTGDSLFNLGLTNYEYTASTPTGSYTGAGDTLTFNINGTDYDISVSTGDSITEIQSKIDANLGNVLTSKIENGVLVFESTDTNMSISSLDGSDIIFGLDNTSSAQTNHIQNATDASFKYNGINITRDSNTIDDLVEGTTITLNKNTGLSNVSITQNTSDISDNLEAFVNSYNELISNLNESTKYDENSGAAGNFQNVNEIKILKSDINKQLLLSDIVPRTEEEIDQLLIEGKEEDPNFSRDKIGNTRTRSLNDFGITLNESGILEFDKSIFDAKISENPTDLEDFFRGSTTYSQTKIEGFAINGTTPNDILNGDLVINDTNIVVSLTGTASEQAQALKEAINNANIEGVVANLNSDGLGINLIESSGYDISVSGDATKLENIGLSEKTVYSQSETKEGYFTKFNSLLASYVTGTESILELYNTQLHTQNQSLIDEKTKTIESLDQKYDTMATRFAAYDSIINKLNNQFQSLSMMIEQSNSSNN
ncbi:flagellar filament capping protein FliD [Sulfurospirillum arcachonense]|uniref:flagellar filament capping protein FliD n=1 Tax=Sulfurospirillum arcachonense TaxID=57666 RepID=UPI0004685835|nr:flagellar filament capping protein FliD [Sulfurospirillum arcachonense]